MARFRSLSIRFIFIAVGLTAVTFVLFIGLVVLQLDRNLARQSEELERLTDVNLRGLLDADLRLAVARLRFQGDDIARRVQGIGMRADIEAAVESQNMVAMEAILAPAARVAEVDSIIAIDASANVIGASIRNADLVAIDAIVRASPLRGRFEQALSESERGDLKTVSTLVPRSEFSDLGGKGDAHHVAQIIMVPVLDDFGEVTGGLVAQRWFRPAEPILEELAGITQAGISVHANGTLVSTAAIARNIVFSREGERILATAGGQQLIARCSPAINPLTLCAFKPLSELFAAQDKLTGIGQTEGRKLVNWLIGMGILSALGMSAAIALTALPITVKLRELSRIVSAVARGDYDVTVQDTDRADEIGEISRAVVVLRDSVRERDNLRASIVVKNTELERQEHELRHQNLLFDAALNNMSHGLCMFDAQKRLITSNTRYSEIFGIDARELASGLPLEALLQLQTLVAESESDGEERQAASDPSDWPVSQRSSVTQRLTDGRTILTTRQPLSGGGWVVIYEDITERQKARARLVHQAKHDSLTKLPNRIRLREQLTARLEQIASQPGHCFAVFCIDLDEFKVVNDTLGHPTGDILLQQVADRLVKIAGQDDLVIRLGGDEFAVVTAVGDASDFSATAEHLIQTIGEPYDLNGQEVIIGASVGVAIGARDGADPDELMKHGDLALYRAKSEGRNTFSCFRPEMAESLRERQQLISDLRNAIEADELTVFFQPQTKLEDGSIAAFEALVRWRHPKHGMISPLSFIPVAEETGLIVPIGEWILRESCRHAVMWPIPVRVAVNISARQLRDRGFVSMVVNALATSGLPATRLELEITESVLLQDNEETRSTLLQLKALGIAIAMDDFGTGYSSLSCLRSFPFDKIKIDQSFVRVMNDGLEASSIVSAIIELASNLNISTTAEGIEDQATMDELRRKGCREGQGYFIGRPASAEAAIQLLNEAGGQPIASLRRRRA